MAKNLYSFLVLFIMMFSTYAQVIPLDPDVRFGKLPNGFTYYIRHNAIPTNKVEVILGNSFGSIIETDGQFGMVVLLKQLSTAGTKHFSKKEIDDLLLKTGNSGNLDDYAYSGFDETVYQFTMPANADTLRRGIQLMRDWAQDAVLDSSNLAEAQRKLLATLFLGGNGISRMQHQYFPATVKGSRYENWPFGTEESVMGFNQQNVSSFYKNWYRPNLQSLMIVGDIDVATIESLIKNTFSDLKNPKNELPRLKYRIKLNGKNTFAAVTDREQTETAVTLMIKHDDPGSKTIKSFRESTVRYFFNQMLAARFAKLKLNSNFVTNMSAEIRGLTGGLDMYMITVSPNSGKNDLENSIKAIWLETIKVYKAGFTEEEFLPVKTNFIKGHDAAYKLKREVTSSAFAQKYLQHFLREWSVPSAELERKLYIEMLPGINLTDVNNLAKIYAKADKNRDIVILAPDAKKAVLPDKAMLNTWITEKGL